MRFYNVDMKGKFFMERSTALPSADPSNEGRLFYNETDESPYIHASASWKSLFDASNLNAGTVPTDRLSGTYNIDISGTADAAKYS